MTVTWEAPKSTRKFGTRGAWTEEAAELRARPGEWGVIGAGTATDEKSRHRPYGLAGHIRAGGYKAFQPKGAYEAKVEFTGDDYKVFARYTGTPTPVAGEDQAVAAEPTFEDGLRQAAENVKPKRRTVQARAS